jgi:hypothetical protein
MLTVSIQEMDPKKDNKGMVMRVQELTAALPKASAAWSLSSCISSVIKGAS